MEKEWNVKDSEEVARILNEEIPNGKYTMYQIRRHEECLIIILGYVGSSTLHKLDEVGIHYMIFPHDNKIELWLSK